MLQDIEKIPQVLGEILKVRIKIDNTLELMKGDANKKTLFSCIIKDLISCISYGCQISMICARQGSKLQAQGEEIMVLHDQLAEIKCENGNGEPNPESLN